MNDVDRMFDDFINEEKLVNHVAIVLDVSGSMGRFGSEPMDNFNNQLETLKKEKGKQKTLLTYVEFGERVDVKYVDEDVDDVKLLTEYNASQVSTRLNDAVGITISKIRNQVEKNENHSALMIIITDGNENDSREFRTPEIKKLIDDLKKTEKWTFTFMGTDDINTEEIGTHMAFSVGNIAKFDSARGMSATASYGGNTVNYSVADRLSEGVSRYFNARRTGQTSINNFYEEEENAE